MLTVKRKSNQGIVIKTPEGKLIKIYVEHKSGDKMYVRVEADRDFLVLREELLGTAEEKPMCPDEITEWFKRYQDEAYEIFLRKHAFYGPKNIGIVQESGVVIRLLDKISRLSNVLLLNHPDDRKESLEDTFLDIANYGIIGLVCLRGKWPVHKIEDSIQEDISERNWEED